MFCVTMLYYSWFFWFFFFFKQKTEYEMRISDGSSDVCSSDLDLAATAVWGTQMLASSPQANKDGLFAIWYGKGPGVDRSGDPFKHGNMAGTHPNGGVLIVAGDDHSGKSSTVAHQSEVALMHAGMPILAPSDVQDVIDLGLLGFAMSRYTGLYTGFKLCNEILEQTMTVELPRSEEHTSDLQSLMRNSYAVFCLKKKKYI